MYPKEAGDILAKEFSISRREQDEYAAYSHRKATEAIKAIKAGVFNEEILPVVLKAKGVRILPLLNRMKSPVKILPWKNSISFPLRFETMAPPRRNQPRPL